MPVVDNMVQLDKDKQVDKQVAADKLQFGLDKLDMVEFDKLVVHMAVVDMPDKAAQDMVVLDMARLV